VTKVTCYTCHVTFATREELSVHKKNDCKSYQCPHCEQEPYTSETFYKYHLLTHSDRWPELEKDPKALEAAKRKIRLDREKYRRIHFKPPMKLSCPKPGCDRTFAYQTLLTNHMNSHDKGLSVRLSFKKQTIAIK
jgi:hypothetical protein